MRRVLGALATGFALFFALPIGLSALLYWIQDDGQGWRTADRSSAGLLPPPTADAPAVVRVFAARTVRWRGIFATHSWIVIKEAGAARYRRWDYTAWGEPIRVDGFEADGRWFGRVPQTVLAVDGAAAERAIPAIQAAIAAYAHRDRGAYQAWPGPNSNTFVAAVLGAVPDIAVALPATAVGRDFPHDGRWLAPTASGTGWRINLAGYGGLAIGWMEGIELNLLGAVLGVEWRRPAINLPGLGRFGVPALP
ncbi:hypothetical protein STVA_40190 [Allostella vacuolata]|nr:hypothetical protein STVA_40190 [Stella vacuolata]